MDKANSPVKGALQSESNHVGGAVDNEVDRLLVLCRPRRLRRYTTTSTRTAS